MNANIGIDKKFIGLGFILFLTNAVMIGVSNLLYEKGNMLIACSRAAIAVLGLVFVGQYLLKFFSIPLSRSHMFVLAGIMLQLQGLFLLIFRFSEPVEQLPMPLMAVLPLIIVILAVGTIFLIKKASLDISQSVVLAIAAMWVVNGWQLKPLAELFLKYIS